MAFDFLDMVPLGRLDFSYCYWPYANLVNTEYLQFMSGFLIIKGSELDLLQGQNDSVQ